MSKIIYTTKAPEAIGPYSQALCSGGLVLTSGQIAIDPASGQLTGGTVAAQTAQVCRNLAAVLEKAGSSLDKAVKTTCYLCDMDDFAAFNEVYGRYFSCRPARSCVAVRSLPKGALIEVEVVAEL